MSFISFWRSYSGPTMTALHLPAVNKQAWSKILYLLFFYENINKY